MSDGHTEFQPHPSSLSPLTPTPGLLKEALAGPALQIDGGERAGVGGGEGRGHWRKPALFTPTDKPPL